MVDEQKITMHGEEGERGSSPTPSISGTNEQISFADKIKAKPELQVAIYTEPIREFTEMEKLDFMDAMGNKMFELPDEVEMPKFLYTARRDQYLIVAATNEYSRDWLIKAATDLSVWEGVKFQAILANNIPKLQKGLMWFPGRQKLKNEDLLKRLAKQNPGLQASKWRVFSRHEEEHGTRLLVGVHEECSTLLSSLENQPWWTTRRAQFTPIQKVKERQKQRKSERKGKELIDPKVQKIKPVSKKAVANLLKATKRKPEFDLSLGNSSPTANTPTSAARQDQLVVQTPTETERAAQDVDRDPFTPTRSLPRSPAQAKSIQRPPKKKKDEGPAEPGKITDFFQRERKTSLPALCPMEGKVAQSGSTENNDAEKDDF